MYPFGLMTTALPTRWMLPTGGLTFLLSLVKVWVGFRLQIGDIDTSRVRLEGSNPLHLVDDRQDHIQIGFQVGAADH